MIPIIRVTPTASHLRGAGGCHGFVASVSCHVCPTNVAVVGDVHILDAHGMGVNGLAVGVRRTRGGHAEEI